MNVLNIKNWLLIGFMFLFLAACNNDDEDEAGTEADLVGLWTTQSVSLDVTLNGEDFLQYLVEALGVSESEAQAFMDLSLGDLKNNFEGTVDMKSDGTYVSTFGDETIDGTWSLSSDGKKLTLDAGTTDEITMDIVELTSNTLKLAFSETETTEDIDGDDVNDELKIDIEMTLTK